MARRVTSQRVRFLDAASRVVITIGGVGIVAAVLAIMVYLGVNVLPLFSSGRLVAAETRGVTLAGEPVLGVIDEYRGGTLFMLRDGRAQGVQTDSWTTFAPEGVAVEGGKASAISQVNDAGSMAIGLGDGRVQVVTFGFETDFIAQEDATPAMKALERGQRLTLDAGYVEMTPQRQLRRTVPKVVATAPVELGAGSGGVERIDFRASSGAQYLVVLRGDGTLVFNTVSITRPLGGGKPRTRLESEVIPFTSPKGLSAVPDYLFAKDGGTQVLAIWIDGTVQRYTKPLGEQWQLGETTDVLPEGGRTITAARMLLGSRTLVLGDSAGEVRGVFAARSGTMRTPDGEVLVVAHRFETGYGLPITAIGNSMRDRCFVVGDGGGNLVVWHMTSGKEIVRLARALPGAIALASVAPKLDGLGAIDAQGKMVSIAMGVGHPEASVRALFGRVWYEGDPAPAFTYQASTGEDTAETKYSKVPLIFGTIKATLYAMLFAVPIALLAALYTSEFLHPRVKNGIKPVIEMMASLPSVVLGFLAAIVIAPIFRDILPGVLTSLLVVPAGVLTGAYLWQLVPIRVASRLSNVQHLLLVVVIVLGAGLASIGLGRAAQGVLFTPTADEQLVMAGSTQVVPRAEWPESLRDVRSLSAEQARPFRGEGFYYRDGGLVRPVGDIREPATAQLIAINGLDRADMRLWLDGVIGGPWPGWILVMTAPGLILTVLLRARFVDPFVQALPFARVGISAALLELGKFVGTLVVGLGVAGVLAWVVSASGLDPRDSILGSYTQRNTLVVGIVMGFAVIPIIYTISEDALSAVPGQLRSASLGCGATRWQTATRVVLPIALSGIFSAVMIGLGRAAGETMIVLMATGNTPGMSMNIFSGFRTLAANIAVEMPEASKASTHYYVLFLGALCLFALTFVVNTLAEFVRIRVRRRSAAL
ncbi:MAG: ABC transporter permease subunit [bacterium]